MGVRLRLQRVGKPKKPQYRIVAIDCRKKRDGKALEIIGRYDPFLKDQKEININRERIIYWLKVGAKPSRIVNFLLKKHKVLI